MKEQEDLGEYFISIQIGFFVRYEKQKED